MTNKNKRKWSSPQSSPWKPTIDVYKYSFCNLMAKWGWVLSAMTWPVYPKGKPRTHWVGRWTGTRAILDGCRHDNCQNTISKLSKELCSRLSTRWKIFTLPYDVFITISKYSQIYQTPKFIPTTRGHCPTSLPSATHTQSTSSHLQPPCPLFS